MKMFNTFKNWLRPEISRMGWWPGLQPDISKDRIVCSNCIHHSMAPAGWQYDRCTHPDADEGNTVRAETPRCCDMRNSAAQCGKHGKWFVVKEVLQVKTNKLDSSASIPKCGECDNKLKKEPSPDYPLGRLYCRNQACTLFGYKQG